MLFSEKQHATWDWYKCSLRISPTFLLNLEVVNCMHVGALALSSLYMCVYDRYGEVKLSI